MAKIEYLSDFPVLTETVACWIYNEFIVDARPGITFDKTLCAVKNTNRAKLPIRLVAFLDGNCAGTVSILSNDLRCRPYTPWLAALYVSPPFRGNKIGEQLVERVKEIARELGYRELYLRTEHTGDYYRNRNWQYVEKCMDDEFWLETEVFRISL